MPKPGAVHSEYRPPTEHLRDRDARKRGPRSVFELLDRGDFRLDGADALHVELPAAIEPVDAVLFLEHVGQLGVAVAKHARVVEQRRAEALEAGVELVDGLRTVAVAPGVLAFLGLGVPPDAAELGDEERLAVIRARDRISRGPARSRGSRRRRSRRPGGSSRWCRGRDALCPSPWSPGTCRG
jgi:hypothetical protein